MDVDGDDDGDERPELLVLQNMVEGENLGTPQDSWNLVYQKLLIPVPLAFFVVDIYNLDVLSYA